MGSIADGYSKCIACIKEGSAAEKDVFVFRKYGICICEEHLNQIVSEYMALKILGDTMDERDDKI